MVRKIFYLFLFIAGAFVSLHAQSAEEILANFDKTKEVPTIQGSFAVQLISPNGDVREIQARAYQKLVGPAQSNRLFLFDFPPTVRGTGLLLHSYFDGRENNMWIYLPAIRRVKRIALESSGGGYFMGSDFSYRDLIDNDNSKLDFERLPDQVIHGFDSYVIKAWGQTPQDRQEHGYSYIVTYHRKDNYVIHLREYYDFNGDLLKIYRVEELLDLHPHYYPTVMTMENVQTGHRSVLRVTEASTEDIPDRFFTTRYLQNN
jgi:hypothetical protein